MHILPDSFPFAKEGYPKLALAAQSGGLPGHETGPSYILLNGVGKIRNFIAAAHGFITGKTTVFPAAPRHDNFFHWSHPFSVHYPPNNVPDEFLPV